MFNLSEHHHNLLKEIIESGMNCARLSTWELDFIDSLSRRLEAQGREMFMSEKQWEVLTKIEAKIYLAG